MEAKSLAFLEFGKILGLIAGFAGSQAGKDAIAALQPSAQTEEVENRLADLDEYLLCLDSGKHLSVGGMREMRDLLEVLQKGEETLTGDELLRVRANIDVMTALRRSIPETIRNIPRLTWKIQNTPDLANLGRLITQTINEQGQVRDDASPRLAGIRRDLAKALQDIEKRLTEYLNAHADILQDRFFTVRNDRYVVPVKASAQSQIQGIIHDSSGSGQTVFMEPLEFLALNNRLARLKAEDREEMARILAELTAELSNRLRDLALMFEILVFFDVLQAKARFARKFDGNRPQICGPGSFALTNARHPLIHPDCVPLDISMNSQQACIIITGPNGGGKTVVLKTLGVNALLMQIGSYILAAVDSRLPVFQEILADIGESQSIEDHLSTFTSHIKRLNEILARADNRSLVLVDEIGGGTDPVEGSALAVGVLRALVRRGSLSLATSHYDSLKQAAFTTPGFANAGMEFDYDNFRPTFRFLQGVPGRSNALSVARQFGVPDEVLSEMTALLQGKGGQESDLLQCLERERMKAEALRRSWELRDRDLKLRQDELEKAMVKLEEFRRNRRDEIVEQYEDRLRSQVKSFESLIHDLKTALAGGQASAEVLARARQALVDVKDASSKLGDISLKAAPELSESAAPLEVGSLVLWAGFPSPGYITYIDPDQKRATVDFDGKTLNVAFSELEAAPEKLALKKKPKSTGGIAVGASPMVRSDLDLRGMRVEEALEKTESYLRLASAQKLDKVFLIHGKGTGALQKAIHEYLKKSPYRNKFRLGRYGEGDLGVTVVVFNPAADAHERPDPLGQPKKGSPRGR